MSFLPRVISFFMVPLFIAIMPLSLLAGDLARPAAGINLAGPADWSTELPFVDVFKLSRAWISQRQGEAWGKGPPLDLDEHGWIRSLEDGCFAETPLCTIAGGHYPSGEWTVLWKGSGEIELSKGKVLSRSPGKMIVEINSGGGGFFLRLRQTDSKNPVRRIQVLMPGMTAEQALSNPWNPTFLMRWKGMACLRFMDLQETNNSEQKTWGDRPHLEDATYTRKGLPLELLCDLANRLDCDAWFCVPHAADDDYVQQMARLIATTMPRDRRMWIEYSNEVWNGQFAQHRYAAKQGQTLGLAEKTWEAAWRFTAQRSVEIFRIFEEELKGRGRLVRVLPAQAANSYVAEQILGWNDAAKHADVLAIAPYISMNIPPQGEKLSAETVLKWNIEQFLDYVEQKALPESVDWMVRNQQVAEKHGLQLVCYEAGQHFVGIQGAEQNDQLTSLLHSANAHPRMRDIYGKYFSAWQDNRGGLLCHFSSVSEWSKWGSWGLLEYADDSVQNSPKFDAFMAWARSLRQPVNIAR